MTRKRFHGLKRIKIRQTWNKYNLYNLFRLQTQYIGGRTFFQQKWAAKAATRAYHGEHIKEGKWTRMFSRYIPSVVPMDAAALAIQDGTVESAGRGSGKDGGFVPDRSLMTPYMNNTYWMTERRLDTAIWRALFASSARQARQFVVHGHVKVNGKRMKHPSYLLNPGDMFTVDVDSVLYATGAPKNNKEDVNGAPKSKLRPAEEEDVVEEVAEEEEEEFEDVVRPAEPEEPEQELEEENLQPNDADIIKTRLTTLRNLRDLATTLQTSTKNLNAKRKRELRDLYTQAKRLLSKVRSVSAEEVTELEANFESVLAKLDSPDAGPVPSTFREIKTVRTPREDAGSPMPSKYRAKVAAAAAAKLENHLSRLSLIPNPVDESKAYKTPWRPRDYMSPFAFVPRYLEVNHTVCSAVYLRHPVARPGLAEVPTPFDLGIGSLAFAWYLRRR